MQRRVLLIDDDEMLLNLLQELMHKEGYEVLSTADGPQGVRIYKERRPDLVVLDLGLPTMNGLEVLRKIRTFDPQAKVVVVTGHATEESAEVALGLGAVKYLRKPIDISSMLKELLSAFQS